MGLKKEKVKNIRKSDFRFTNDLWFREKGKLTTKHKGKKLNNPKKTLKNKIIHVRKRKVFSKGRTIAIHFIINENPKKEKYVVEKIISKFIIFCKENHLKYEYTVRQGSDIVTLIAKVVSPILLEILQLSLNRFVNYIETFGNRDENSIITDLSLDMKTVHDFLVNQLSRMGIIRFRIEQYNTLEVGVRYKGVDLRNNRCWEIIVYWNLNTDKVPC